jgi:hypothetical protein
MIYFRYLKQFKSEISVSERSMNFEKSATYFDSILAMKRIKALLPNVRLIMILTEPGARAYSRYQVRYVKEYGIGM